MRWAFAVTVASSPLYVVRWHLGPLPTTLLEAMILVTCGLYALQLLWHRAPLPSGTGYEIPIALLLLAAVIGIFIAPDQRGALGIFRAYFVEPIALYYVAIALLKSTPPIELLLGVWAVGAAVFSVIEVVTFLSALIAHRLVASYAAAAFNIDANAVAMYLEPLIGMAAGFALFDSGRRRTAGLALIAFLLPAELATLSRGGLLALAALAVIGILTVRSPRLRIGLAAGAVAGGLAVWKAPVIGPRVSHAIDPISGTFDNRGRIWAATFRMLRDHPFFGAGLNSYQSTMAPYREADSNLVPEPYPHNILLATWTELGVLGLFAFTWLISGLIILPWRYFGRATGVHRALLWGAGAAFTMLLVHGMVDTPYWKNDLSLEFWILAAISVVSLKSVNKTSPSR